MNDISAIRILRWVVSIPMTLFTAVTAALWAFPKVSAEGGALWLLSLPVGALFVYLTHRITAPPREKRSIAVPIALTFGLVLLYFGGIVLGSLSLPADTLSNLSVIMMGLTFLWPSLGLLALLSMGILKVIDLSIEKSRAKSALGARPVASAHPAASLSPPPIYASAASPVPAKATPVRRADARRRSGVASAPSAASSSSSVSAPSTVSAPSAPEATWPAAASEEPQHEAPPVLDLDDAPAALGVPLHEFATLLEVAASLEGPDAPELTLLTFTPGGVEVSIGDTDLGSVDGHWTGPSEVRTLQSATAALTVLADLEPSAVAVALVPPLTDEEDLQIHDEESGQRLVVDSVRV